MKTSLLGMLAVLLVGCGSSVVAGTGGNTGAGGNGSGASPCPAAEPAGGNVSCAGVPEGFRCTYGESVRPECRHDWTCSGGTWVTTKSFCQDFACSAVEPTSNAQCDGNEGTVCVYGNDICICSACLQGPCMQNAVWGCAKPPTGAGCPPVVPNDGAPCDTPGAECDYGFVCGSSGAQAICMDGTWRWDQGVGCAL